MQSTQPNDNASQMRLYNEQSRRLYLNASERLRFKKVAHTQPLHIKAFCLTLLYTGCRISEARELTAYSIQHSEGIISVRSLKKRNQHHIREIPIPQELLSVLKQLEDVTEPRGNGLLWCSRGNPIDRITAYRWIKSVMKQAKILGVQACPKGLRHGYGIHAVRCGVQLNMLQKWMGHASIKTTSIYANAVGEEEREIAKKMW